MEFKDSKTARNLMKAFAGESQARNRYTYYAGVARKQGYLQIAAIFIETAENEKEHAKLFYKKLLEHGMNEQVVVIDGAGYPVAMDDTLKNLQYAADGEQEEWTTLYVSFANEAEAEGYLDVAKTFRLVALVEERHEARFRKLHDNVENHRVFVRDGQVFWKCLNCGHIVEAGEAPARCPVCLHGREYFELWKETY